MGASVAKKTRCYATGLNLVPLSDVKNNGYERPQELSRRLRAEQAAEEAKALKAAELADPIFIAKKEFEERVNQTSREVTARLTKWWGRSVPDCEEGIRFDECPVDDIGLEQTETPVPMPASPGFVADLGQQIAHTAMRVNMIGIDFQRGFDGR